MESKSVDVILKDKLKLDANLLEPPNKIKKLHVTKDGDIIDNDELSLNFVQEIYDIRNKKVLEWAIINPTTCNFVMEVFHPNKEDKFIEFVSECRFDANNPSNLTVIYIDNIILYDSDDDDINGKKLRINLIEPFLYYLKNKGLIKDIKFSIKNI